LWFFVKENGHAIGKTDSSEKDGQQAGITLSANSPVRNPGQPYGFHIFP